MILTTLIFFCMKNAVNNAYFGSKMSLSSANALKMEMYL